MIKQYIDEEIPIRKGDTIIRKDRPGIWTILQLGRGYVGPYKRYYVRDKEGQGIWISRIDIESHIPRKVIDIKEEMTHASTNN